MSPYSFWWNFADEEAIGVKARQNVCRSATTISFAKNVNIQEDIKLGFVCELEKKILKNSEYNYTTFLAKDLDEKGLDKYYGLTELAIKYNIFKQVSTRIELPDGTTQFGKTIMNNPEKYFTEDVMTLLDEAAEKEYKYGKLH